MGRKSKLKQIRRLASSLPLVMVNRVQGEIVTGEVLSSKGITKVEGQPVFSEQKYRQKKIVQKPLDHNRQMKKLFQKGGVPALMGYVNAVKQHAELKSKK